MIPTWKRDINTHRRVGQHLKQIREAYGLTQAFVAKVTGCSQSAVAHIESGRCGSMELLESVLWAYGLELGDLKLERVKLVSLERARRIRDARKARAPIGSAPATDQQRKAAL